MGLGFKGELSGNVEIVFFWGTLDFQKWLIGFSCLWERCFRNVGILR